MKNTRMFWVLGAVVFTTVAFVAMSTVAYRWEHLFVMLTSVSGAVAGYVLGRLINSREEWPYPHEANSVGLKWKTAYATRDDFERGWGRGVGTMYCQFYCHQCGGRLTPGPTGAGTNQVCEKCRINYGCLPGAMER